MDGECTDETAEASEAILGGLMTSATGERKRRLTRQLISDAATSLFATRGFDAVRVAEVAQWAGVSERTIDNDFPTKESVVRGDADELVEAIATQAGVDDSRDPEPVAAGRALAGLVEVATQSRSRDIREGLRGAELRGALDDDLRRAARLLETGLRSLPDAPP